MFLIFHFLSFWGPMQYQTHSFPFQLIVFSSFSLKTEHYWHEHLCLIVLTRLLLHHRHRHPLVAYCLGILFRQRWRIQVIWCDFCFCSSRRVCATTCCIDLMRRRECKCSRLCGCGRPMFWWVSTLPSMLGPFRVLKPFMAFYPLLVCCRDPLVLA